jgi:hypothetical protein
MIKNLNAYERGKVRHKREILIVSTGLKELKIRETPKEIGW